MKIGILIKRFDDLANWELRIINEILCDSGIELSLLIQDGRKSNTNSFKNKLVWFFRSENKLGKIIFKLQNSIENLIFEKPHTVDKKKIINNLETIDMIKLCPKTKAGVDVFSEDDGERIKDFDLDLILKHEFNEIQGPILNSAKHGVWSFQYGDDAIDCSGLAGFYEVLLERPYVKVSLQRLTDEPTKGIIDEAFFNRHWSFLKTKRMVLEASVSLLLKNILKLRDTGHSLTNIATGPTSLQKSPNFRHTFKYMLSFYAKIWHEFIQRINTRLFGTRYGCWTLFIGEDNFMNLNISGLRPVKMPKNEFWADPFVIGHNNEKYVFFENYSYSTKRGKISCGKIKDGDLVDIQDVLDFDYHLSFPFIFKENGALFLMPETKENNRLELYRCVAFPHKWELHATAFEGEKVVDAFFYDDDEGQKWMFVNKQADRYAPADSELFIYKVDSLRLNKLVPHRSNPVIIDSRKARNAGAIFKFKDETYRPAQANIDGVYGRALHIGKIKKLTIDEYIEEDVTTVYPDFQTGLVAMHHLHQSNGLFVIDAAYRKK